MTHYAKIESGIVTTVLVAERDFIDNHMTGTWVQTQLQYARRKTFRT